MKRSGIRGVIIISALLLSPLFVHVTYNMFEARLVRSSVRRIIRPLRPTKPARPTPPKSTAPASSSSSAGKVVSVSSSSQAAPASSVAPSVSGPDEKRFTLKSGEIPYDFSEHRENATTNDVIAEMASDGVFLRNHEFLTRPKTVFGTVDYGPTLESMTTATCLQAIRGYPLTGVSLIGAIPACVRTGEGELVVVAADGKNTVRYRILGSLGTEGPGTIQITDSSARYNFTARAYGAAVNTDSYEVEFISIDQQVEVHAEKKGMAVETVYAPFDAVTAIMCADALASASPGMRMLPPVGQEVWSLCVRTQDGYLVKIGAASGTGKGNASVKFHLWRTSSIPIVGDVIPVSTLKTHVNFPRRILVQEKESHDAVFTYYPNGTIGNEPEVAVGGNGLSLTYSLYPYEETTDKSCTFQFHVDSAAPSTFFDKNRTVCFKTGSGLRGKLGKLQSGNPPSVRFELWTGTPPVLDLTPPPPPAAKSTPLSNGTVSLQSDAFIDLSGMNRYTLGSIEQMLTIPFDLTLGTSSNIYSGTRFVRALGKPDMASNAESVGIDFALPWTSFTETTADVCKRALEVNQHNVSAHLTEHTDAVCFVTQAGVLGKLGRAKTGKDAPSVDIEVWVGETVGARRDATQAWEVSDAQLSLKGSTVSYLDTHTLTLHAAKDQPHDFGFAYDAKADRMVVTDAVYPGKARLAFSTFTYRGPGFAPCVKALENPQAPGGEHVLAKTDVSEGKIFCFENSRGYVGALAHEKGKDTVILWIWRRTGTPKPPQPLNACPYLIPPSGKEHLLSCKNGTWGLKSCTEQGATELTAGMTCAAGETLGMNDAGELQGCCASPVKSCEIGLKGKYCESYQTCNGTTETIQNPLSRESRVCCIGACVLPEGGPKEITKYVNLGKNVSITLDASTGEAPAAAGKEDIVLATTTNDILRVTVPENSGNRVVKMPDWNALTAQSCSDALASQGATSVEITLRTAVLCFSTQDGYVGRLRVSSESLGVVSSAEYTAWKFAHPAAQAAPSTASASASVSSVSSASVSSASSVSSVSAPPTASDALTEDSPTSTGLTMDAKLAQLLQLMGQPSGLMLQMQDLQTLLNENEKLMGLVQAGSIDARLAQMAVAALQAKQANAPASTPVTSVLKTGDTSDASLRYTSVNQTTYTRVCRKKRFAGIKYKTECSNVPQTMTTYTLGAIGNVKIASLSGTAFDAATEDQCRTALKGNTGNSMPFPNNTAVACVQFLDGSVGKAGKADASGITITRWPKASTPNI